jgi:hypothetical protein
MTEEINLKVEKFKELIKEINDEAKKILMTAAILNKKMIEIFQDEKNIPRELKFLLENHSKELNLLILFSIFNSYEKINISQSRGITTYYLPNKENPIQLYLNGKEQAKVEFYSNLEHYTEGNLNDLKIVTYEELLKKFPELKETYDFNA